MLAYSDGFYQSHVASQLIATNSLADKVARMHWYVLNRLKHIMRIKIILEPLISVSAEIRLCHFFSNASWQHPKILQQNLHKCWWIRNTRVNLWKTWVAFTSTWTERWCVLLNVVLQASKDKKDSFQVWTKTTSPWLRVRSSPSNAKQTRTRFNFSVKVIQLQINSGIESNVMCILGPTQHFSVYVSC